MTIVSVTKAALMCGKHRKTIQRYINQGIIEKKGGGIDTDDLAELFNLTKKQFIDTDTSDLHATTNKELHLINRVRFLEDHVNQLSLENKKLIKIIDEKLTTIENKIFSE